MKVAIDLRPLQIGHQNRGIGSYLLNLLERLPDDRSVNFVFLRYDLSDPIRDFHLPIPGQYEEVLVKKYHFSKNPFQLSHYVLSSLAPKYRKLLRHQPDVFFQADYLLGAPRSKSCRLVIVVHDLIPFKLRPMYLPAWSTYVHFHQLGFRKRVRSVLRAWFYERLYSHGVRLLQRSDVLVSVSENTAADVVSLLGIPQSKIKTILLAASFRDSPEEAIVRPAVKRQIDRIQTPFVTYIGGTDLRREIDELVAAFNLYNARRSGLSLVLCGNEFETGSPKLDPDAREAIKQSSYGSNIHCLGRVTEAEKRYILTQAAAFIYPTLYEGFGLPLLEAMQCGTPVISYRNSSIPEILGNCGIYTETAGAYALFLAIRELLSSNDHGRQLGYAGQQRAASFTWEKCAAETWELVTKS